MNALQPSDRFVLAAQRSKAVSERLRAMARVSRFSSSGKRRGGSRAEAYDRRATKAVWIAVFFIPTLAAIVYYGLILAPRYVTPLDVSLRGAETTALPDKEFLSHFSALETVQNTMIVLDYIRSRTIIEDLEKLIPLRQIYASPEADFISRIDPEEPVEDLQEHLKDYITTELSGQSLAIRMKIKAFTPEDSLKVAQAVQAVCEAMINRLSTRARDTAMREAHAQLTAAEKQLAVLHGRMQDLRNEQGIVDATATAKQRLTLLTSVEKQRIEVDLQIRSLETQLSADAPSLRRLRDQRDQLDRAIDEQKRAIASPGRDQSVLSTKMLLFESLDVQRKAAELSYVNLLKAAQIARIAAERQQVFLNTIVAPSRPESAREPHRLFNIAIATGLAALAAVALTGLRRFLNI